MSKVLITGGAGFIGMHLARRLLELGHRVHLVDAFVRGIRDAALEELVANAECELFEVDLTRGDALANLADDYDHIYHLAAIVGVAHVVEAPYRVLHDNAAMLFSALRFAERQRHLRRFTFASTSEVYAATLERVGLAFPTPESALLVCPDPGSRRGSYMLSKIFGEALCSASGLPITVVRPHNVYGPRMGLAHVVPELLERAFQAPDGGELDVYSVDHRRTFCYVSDAVEMIRLASEAAAGAGETYNVGNSEPEVSIGALAELVCRVVGTRLRVVARPATAGSPPRRVPDTTRIRSLTQYAAQVDLEEGLRRTFSWYRDVVFTGRNASAK